MTKSQSKNWRLVFVAIIGGIYAVLFYYPIFSFAYSSLSKLVFSLALVLFAFGFKSIKKTLSTTLIFFFCSFAIAGMVYAIMGLTNIKMLMFSTIASYFCTLSIERIYDKKNKLTKYLDNICIKLGNRQANLIALRDTGNESQIPIVEFNSVKCILPESFTLTDNYDDLLKTAKKFKSLKPKFLPFKTIAGSKLLLGVELEINGELKTVGLNKEKLSDEYEAII